MKLVAAYLRQDQVERLREVLLESKINRFTVINCVGQGKQEGYESTFRGVDYVVTLLRKVKLEVIVKDSDLSKVVEAVKKVAHEHGEGEDDYVDGLLFISSIDNVINLFNDKTDEDALD